ncbi:hypothetical protein [Bradyrhizobium sp. Arg816]|uniref:hypothetical protein n=1 Tax=Bradyrhizobium sp. Arg816 TaxID=2998491 RepID=UPI00249DCE09|nr:hypothetical protein [Bradyrhizobium sp. Arg816]MDI3560180.1 hypothetical protein [Bradyrhizobium sp. Arg816]
MMHVVDLSIRGLPKYDSNGVPTGLYKPDLKAAISGIKLAAHIGGLLAQKFEVGRPDVIGQMTDTELEVALLGECRALGLSERSLAEIRKAIERD